MWTKDVFSWYYQIKMAEYFWWIWSWGVGPFWITDFLAYERSFWIDTEALHLHCYVTSYFAFILQFLVHQISSNAAGRYNIFVSNTEGNKLTMILLLHIFKDAEIQTSIAIKMFVSYLNLVIAWTSMEVTQMEKHAIVKPQPF